MHSPSSEISTIQTRLIGQGALVLLAGFVFGFGYLFFLLGRIELWPIPGAIPQQLPGTIKAWRMSHLEGVLNGLFLWLFAAILPAIPVSTTYARRIATAFIAMAWLLPFASVLDALFPNSRGLSFHAPFTNNLAFFMFYVGIVWSMWAVGVIAVSCLRRRPVQAD